MKFDTVNKNGVLERDESRSGSYLDMHVLESGVTATSHLSGAAA